MKILLVDADRDLVELLTFALNRAGFTVLPALDTPTALQLLERELPNLAVVDGFELLKTIRQRSQLPVIMLTARASEDDKIGGLELGADDYVTKPFSHRELVARIRAQLRRQGSEWSAPAEGPEVLEVGPITLNVAEHTVTNGGRPVALTVTEFRLLHYLMLNSGSVVPLHNILKHIWGYDDPAGTDVLRVTMYRLRQKLQDSPDTPRLLHTVPGVGVMLKPEPS